MPWTWLARLVFAAAFYFVARRRMQGRPVVDADAVRRHVDTGLHAGMVAARAVAMVTLGATGAVLVTAATSLLVLGPRWLGAAVAVLALIFVAAAVQEAWLLRREVVDRRKRRHALEIVAEADRTRLG